MGQIENMGVKEKVSRDSESADRRAICEYLVDAKKLDSANVERALR